MLLRLHSVEKGAHCSKREYIDAFHCNGVENTLMLHVYTYIYIIYWLSNWCLWDLLWMRCDTATSNQCLLKSVLGVFVRGLRNMKFYYDTIFCVGRRVCSAWYIHTIIVTITNTVAHLVVLNIRSHRSSRFSYAIYRSGKNDLIVSSLWNAFGHMLSFNTCDFSDGCVCVCMFVSVSMSMSVSFHFVYPLFVFVT